MIVACSVLVLSGGPAWAAEDCSPSTHVPVPEEVSQSLNGIPFLLHPGQFSHGGPPPDGIPSIDLPTFTSVADAGRLAGAGRPA